LLLFQLEKLTDAIQDYDSEILELSESEKYKKKKDALICYRGIKTLTAMTLITEIGDVKRFSHPKKLTSYSGLDIKEYSSGGKQKQFGITKMGNHRIRTAVVEACQTAAKPGNIGVRLRRVREGQKAEVIEIADRCMKRLRKKSYKMGLSNKDSNKIKIACARELLSFVWETLVFVA